MLIGLCAIISALIQSGGTNEFKDGEFYLIYFLYLYLIIGVDNFKYFKVDEYIRIGNIYMVIFYLMLGVVLLGRVVWSKKFQTAMLPKIKNLLGNDISLRKMDPDVIEKIIENNIPNVTHDSLADLKLF